MAIDPETYSKHAFGGNITDAFAGNTTFGHNAYSGAYHMARGGRIDILQKHLDEAGIELNARNFVRGVHFGERAAPTQQGRYFPSSSLIGVKKKYDISTIFHEFGHALDYTLGEGGKYGSQLVDHPHNQIAKIFATNVPGSYSQANYYKSDPRESFAEAFSGYAQRKLGNRVSNDVFDETINKTFQETIPNLIEQNVISRAQLIKQFPSKSFIPHGHPNVKNEAKYFKLNKNFHPYYRRAAGGLISRHNIEFLQDYFDYSGIPIQANRFITGLHFNSKQLPGAGAYYEPTSKKISSNEPGDIQGLLHEYGHALDYNVGTSYALKRGISKEEAIIAASEHIGKFKEISKNFDDSQHYVRPPFSYLEPAANPRLYKGKGSSTRENFANAFASYAIIKGQEAGSPLTDKYPNLKRTIVGATANFYDFEKLAPHLNKLASPNDLFPKGHDFRKQVAQQFKNKFKRQAIGGSAKRNVNDLQRLLDANGIPIDASKYVSKLRYQKIKESGLFYPNDRSITLGERGNTHTLLHEFGHAIDYGVGSTRAVYDPINKAYPDDEYASSKIKLFKRFAKDFNINIKDEYPNAEYYKRSNIESFAESFAIHANSNDPRRKLVYMQSMLKRQQGLFNKIVRVAGNIDLTKTKLKLGKFSTGGVVPTLNTGIHEGTDSVPTLLTPGEFVLSTGDVRRLGGTSAVDKMRKQATGGSVNKGLFQLERLAGKVGMEAATTAVRAQKRYAESGIPKGMSITRGTVGAFMKDRRSTHKNFLKTFLQENMGYPPPTARKSLSGDLTGLAGLAETGTYEHMAEGGPSGKRKNIYGRDEKGLFTRRRKPTFAEIASEAALQSEQKLLGQPAPVLQNPSERIFTGGQTGLEGYNPPSVGPAPQRQLAAPAQQQQLPGFEPPQQLKITKQPTQQELKKRRKFILDYARHRSSTRKPFYETAPPYQSTLTDEPLPTVKQPGVPYEKHPFLQQVNRPSTIGPPLVGLAGLPPGQQSILPGFEPSPAPANVSTRQGNLLNQLPPGGFSNLTAKIPPLSQSGFLPGFGPSIQSKGNNVQGTLAGQAIRNQQAAQAHFGITSATLPPIPTAPKIELKKGFASITSFFQSFNKGASQVGKVAQSTTNIPGGPLASKGGTIPKGGSFSGGKAALALGALAVALPAISETTLGTANKPGHLGVGGAAAGGILSGAIAGGTTGAFLGSALGPPGVGTAVGGIAGALTGAASGLKQFNEELEKFSLQKFEESINNATVNLKTGAPRSTVDRGIISSSISGLIKDSSKGLLGEGKIRETSGFSVTERKLTQQEGQVALQALPEEAKKALSDKARTTVTALSEAHPEKSFQQIVKDFGELDTQFGKLNLGQLLRLNNLNIDPVLADIKARKDAANIQEKLNALAGQTATSYELTMTQLDNFSNRLVKATEGFSERQQYSELSSNALRGQLTATPANIGLANVSKPGSIGGRIGSLTKPGTGSYENIKKELTGLLEDSKNIDKLESPDLGRTLKNFFNFGGVGGSHNEAVGKALESTVGAIPDFQKQTREHGVGSTVDRVLELSGVKRAHEVAQQGNKGVQQVYAANQQKQIEVKNRQFELSQSKAGLVGQRAERETGLADTQALLERRTFISDEEGKTGITRDRKKKFRLPLSRVVSKEEFQLSGQEKIGRAGFEASQEVLTGIRGGGSSKQLQGYIQQQQTNIGQLSTQREKAVQTGSVDDVKKFDNAILESQDKIRRYSAAINNIANSTIGLDSAQKKYSLAVSKYQSDLESRTKDADVLTFGSQKEKQQLFQKEAITQQAIQLNPQQFSQLPDQIKKIVGERLKETEGQTRTIQQFDKYGRQGGALNVTGGEAIEYLRKPYLNQLQNTPGAKQLERRVVQTGQGVATEQSKKIEAGEVTNQLSSKDIAEQSVKQQANFQQYITDINSSIERQIQAGNQFLESSAELTTALNAFPRTVEIKRTGQVEVILNGAQVIASMKNDLEASIFKQVIDQLTPHIQKALDNQPAR